MLSPQEKVLILIHHSTGHRNCRQTGQDNCRLISVFVFCNRQRDKLKILYWERNGFWLYYRTLEKGKFQWPSEKDPQTLSLTLRELQWLLDGLSYTQRHAHPEIYGLKNN